MNRSEQRPAATGQSGWEREGQVWGQPGLKWQSIGHSEQRPAATEDSFEAAGTGLGAARTWQYSRAASGFATEKLACDYGKMVLSQARYA